MNSQILPNSAKKLGITLFAMAFLVYFSVNSFNIPGIEIGFLNYNTGLTGLIDAFIGGDFLHIISIILMLGIAIYMFSKEKVEDDYINKIRLESFQIATILVLILAITLFVISKEIKITLDYFIFPFVWSYLILFFLKRKMVI